MAKKAATAGANPAIKRCIDAYHDAFVKRFGCKPLINGGKDGTHFKHMLATWGEGEVLTLVQAFFETTDPRVRRSDYSVGAFYALAQHLRLRDERIDHYRTAANVDAVARATRQERN